MNITPSLLVSAIWKHPLLRAALGWWLSIGIYWFLLVQVFLLSRLLDRRFWWPFTALYMISWLLPPLGTLAGLIVLYCRHQWLALFGIIGAVTANTILLLVTVSSAQVGWLALSLWPFYLR